MVQTKLMVFCYMFLLGIVFAKLVPADATWLNAIHILTGVFFLALAAHYVNRRREIRQGYKYELAWSRVAGWVLVVLAALSLGYGRYIKADTVPDTRMATVVLRGSAADLKVEAQLTDTSRVRIRKTSAVAEDVKLRLLGVLEARLAVLSDDGVPQMDSEGRWRFTRVKQEYASDVIVIGKDDPVGTDYLVPQPFDRITGIEVVEGSSSGHLGIYRISNHLASFVRLGMNSMPVTVLGKISQDPWVYDFKTVLHISPLFIQYRPGGPFYRVEGGTIRANLDTRVDNYRRFARSEGYGLDVVVTAPLFEARPQANPGDFDQRQYLQNNNIYGQMGLRQARGGPPPIVLVAPEGGEPARGHPLVRFSLKIRDDMLRVFKQTLPYPHSAFVGAVTLGLRYGLQGVECIFSPAHGDPLLGQRCEQTIADEFKHSGVNHVLAVSGLHVTIITILFTGIFTLLRMSRRAFVPLIVMILVIFAIITGARPSTLRAVIMNSLFLLTWAYLNKGLVASALLGVPVAAFLILYHNPLMIVDPSFTLSFGAILSLVLITPPVYKLLSMLRGNNFLVAILILLGISAALGWSWFLVTSLRFWIPFLIVCTLLCLGARAASRKGKKLFGNLAYVQIPVAIGTLVASQAAIQWGMMAPLSAAYFSRWAAGGSYANLLALPLIGIVVQLGAMAGLLGMIPVIGPFIGLLLNAANWVFSTGFLWLAHFSVKLFPFPFVRKISPVHLLLYYLILAVFVWHEPLWSVFKSQFGRKKGHRHWAYAMVALLIVLLGAAFATRPHYRHGDDLNLTMLSVNYGNALLVETPGDKKFLIDAGMVEHERGMFNSAERTILPYFSYRSIMNLDGLIVLSPHLERVAGAAYMLRHLHIGTLYLPPALAAVTPDMTEDEFFALVLEGNLAAEYDEDFLRALYAEIIGTSDMPYRPSLARAMKKRGATFVNKWAGSTVPHRALTAGDVVYEEMHNGKRFAMEVLNPSPAAPAGDFPMENRSLVLRISFGDFAMLVSGDLHFDGQLHLAQNVPAEKLAAQVLMAPHHGTAAPPPGFGNPKQQLLDELNRSTAVLLDKVRPEKVVFDYGNPGPVYKQRTRDARAAHEITFHFIEERLGAGNVLSTERDLAIFISSNGEGFEIETQGQKVSSGGETAEAVSSLEVGF